MNQFLDVEAFLQLTSSLISSPPFICAGYTCTCNAMSFRLDFFFSFFKFPLCVAGTCTRDQAAVLWPQVAAGRPAGSSTLLRPHPAQADEFSTYTTAPGFFSGGRRKSLYCIDVSSTCINSLSVISVFVAALMSVFVYKQSGVYILASQKNFPPRFKILPCFCGFFFCCI